MLTDTDKGFFMRIAIDISQSVYEGTGVANYVRNLVAELIDQDTDNEYILFGISFGRRKDLLHIARLIQKNNPRVLITIIPLPIRVFEILWNIFHIVPIEYFVGNIDVYFSSDWIQAPTRNAKKITTIHDLSVFLYPDHYDERIMSVHKRRLDHVAAECDAILCDSKATKDDCKSLLHIQDSRLFVVYPGFGGGI